MTANDILVREAQPSDAPAVREYLAELIAEALPVLVLFDRPPSIDAEERLLRRNLESANSVFLLALLDDRIVGQLEFSGGWQARRAHSGSIAMSVHRSCRGQGVGMALLRHLFAWVDRHPLVSRVELDVLSNNPAAQRLYERAGFHTEGRREAAVLVDGQPVDAILMARLWPGSVEWTAREDGMNVEIAPFDPDFLDECESLIAALPDWFGIPESNASYLRNLSRLPSWVALLGSRVVGAITLEPHFPSSFEVHFMAVRPEHHRHGIGRALLGHLESDVRARGGRWLHVKTLAPSHPDPFYARTRAFYVAMGFEPLFESAVLWGPENPALVLVKAL